MSEFNPIDYHIKDALRDNADIDPAAYDQVGTLLRGELGDAPAKYLPELIANRLKGEGYARFRRAEAQQGQQQQGQQQQPRAAAVAEAPVEKSPGERLVAALLAAPPAPASNGLGWGR